MELVAVWKGLTERNGERHESVERGKAGNRPRGSEPRDGRVSASQSGRPKASTVGRMAGTPPEVEEVLRARCASEDGSREKVRALLA
jgi:hypothetical protein